MALALGTVLVVLGSPYYGSTGSELLHAFARATAVGFTVAALFGVPLWLWPSARVPARALSIALFIALSPLFGIVPGLAVLVTAAIDSAGVTATSDFRQIRVRGRSTLMR